MPPKQKGQNLRGKDKLFRNAVEHVHVGVGHTVLGDISLHLAAGSAKRAEVVASPGSQATSTPLDARPAFYLELNEQLLSHSSKDFKTFRYEVIDLCETRALMDISHRRIAEKLLVRLLDRSGGAVGNKAKSKATKTQEGKGETTEGFAAFVRLTIAFARDMGPKFFHYFEVFHQAVHAGLFDRRGYLLADTRRLQLVFSAQAAWCREMAPFWCLPEHRRLVSRVFDLYIALLSDTRGFVRRLAAELLAYTCRLARPLLPLVVEKIAAEVLDDFQRYVLRSEGTLGRGEENDAESLHDDDEEEDELVEQSGDANEEATNDDRNPTKAASAEPGTPTPVSMRLDEIWTLAHAAKYVKEVLPDHPVTESFGLFAAELMRGIRGSLSSSFELFYLSLLEHTLLITPERRKKVLEHDEVFMAAVGYELAVDEEHETAELTKPAAAIERALHADRYTRVFTQLPTPSCVSSLALVVGEAGDGVVSPEASTTAATPNDDLSETMTPFAREIVRSLATLGLQASLQSVLREVRRNSSHHAYSSSEDEDDNSLEEAEAEEERQRGEEGLAAAADGHQRATTRLLHAVVALLDPLSAHHVHVVNALLSSSYNYLWQDAREMPVLRRLAEKLWDGLKCATASPSMALCPAALHGALLELLVPLCLAPYLWSPVALRAGVAHAASVHANDTHAVAVQKAFLPLGREVVEQLLQLASMRSTQEATEAAADVMEAAGVTLYAFAQDVLQRQFAFYIAEERRAAEEDESVSGGDGARRHAQLHRGAEADQDDDAREDVFVADEQDDGALGSLTSAKQREAQRSRAAARRASDAQAREAQRAAQVLRIKPLLTPLALTLLHALCAGYWRMANDALEFRLSRMTALTASKPQGQSKKNKAEKTRHDMTGQASAVVAGLSARHVERAVLLVRLAHDRTRHVVSSPLQQLLRLKAQTKSTASAAGVELRRCLETMCARLMTLLIQRTEQVLAVDAEEEKEEKEDKARHLVTTQATLATARLAETFENEVELVACCLPVFRDLIALAPADPTAPCTQTSSAESVGKLREPLHGVLAVVRRWMARASARTHWRGSHSFGASVLSVVSPSTGYALYAQVAAVLIHCSNEADPRPAGTPKDLGRTTKSQKLPVPTSVFAHLAQTIDLLASAFDVTKPAVPAGAAAANATDSAEAASSVVEHVSSETERGHLLYATQVLLRSLLWALGLPEDAHTAGKRLSTSTRHALHTLTQALPKDCQERLVHSILLESLVSPMQSLRLLTLRLLVWLCHADLPDEDRLAGLGRVDTELLLALVHAEAFNPLSATGNLDGLKQALAKVTFAAEAGTLTDPFARSLLARAMMGLYYLKFSGAWPLATRILHGLVRTEQTTPEEVFRQSATSARVGQVDASDADDEEEEDGPVEAVPTHAHGTPAASRGRRLEPVVWRTVIVPYAHLMVFGDVVAREFPEARVAAATAEAEDENEEEEERLLRDGLSQDDVSASAHGDHSAVSVVPDNAHWGSFMTFRCPYTITLTDQQRHEKGAMVSRAFSSTQYTDDVVTAVDLASEDGEIISWRRHWVGQLYRATSSSFFTRSTDRTTLAQTFLGALEEMMQHSSAFDSKLRLVEDLVMELVAIDQNEHPAGVTQLRKLDDRLCLAMRACAVAPTTVLSAGQQQRAEASAVAMLQTRNATLRALFVHYTANANAKLQKVALDNLKRLKVDPFLAYHTQLTPYCDSMKGLFGFLASFQLDTIPEHDRADYVATAIAICLPKLIGKVSKEKRRDQAVLQRRLMSFLTELVASSSSSGSGEGDVVTHVLDRVTQRLVLSRVSTSNELTNVEAFDFLAHWQSVVEAAQDRHAVRHLERQARQLTHATRLLQSLLGAVGQRFATYVRSCLHLAVQAYLVACRQHLRDALAKRADACAPSSSSSDDTEEAEKTRVRRWCEEAGRALRTRSLTLTLAELRRTSIAVVAQLLEQFPSESMAVIAEMVSAVSMAEGTDAVHASLFGRYITALYTNTKGTTQQGQALAQSSSSEAGMARKTVAKGTVTPMLRLLLAWISRPPLLPLVVAFADEVTGTFSELFAVNPIYLEARHTAGVVSSSGGHARRGGSNSRSMPPVHKAPAAAVYDALRSLTDLLTRREEPVHLLLPSSSPALTAAAVTSPQKKKLKTSAKKTVALASDSAVSTLQTAFLSTHITPIFTSLYKLIMHGDDGGDAEGKSGNGAAAGRFSVMAFTVPMWKEVIRTVSLLAQQLDHNAAGGDREGDDTAALQHMLGRLLEVSLKFVVHPICVTDIGTVVMAVQVVQHLFQHLREVDFARHYRPLVHLFNTVTNPEARLKLCDTVKCVVTKMHLVSIAGDSEARADDSAAAPQLASQAHETDVTLAAQMAAVARAVACLNSFDDANESLDRYDFDLRYHTFHSLQQFFSNNGNYGALTAGHNAASSSSPAGGGHWQGSYGAVRKERSYDGELDVRIPVAKPSAPVLAIPGFQLLAANVMFFLRDPESTVRAQAVQLFYAMMRYATAAQQQQLYPAGYAQLVLEQVVRQGVVLSTLRHGVVARDVHVRNDHMNCFGALGRYYATNFPSFHALHSSNTAQDFFQNVGHVQHKCRLHALALLRKLGPQLQLRDVLRVIVPYLVSAVKDFAQGKRDLQNLTEGRAKGYCDAVLITIASLAEHMPWEAYYRVLTLFLSNAGANASLRMPMLRGVVQVLENFHFLETEVPEAGVPAAAAKEARVSDSDDDDDDDVQDDDETVRADVAQRRRQFRHQRILHVLEQDVLPQLFSFIGNGKEGQKTLGLTGELKGSNVNTISSVRKEQEFEDKAVTKNAILQLPVALAVTRIVKHFPEDRFNFYVDHLMDELVRKLRTKNDRHRDSARRILGAMLQETGPGKLRPIITKLKDNLIHGYQLHVLGYTVVTLLFQLYEPQSAMASRRKDVESGGRGAGARHYTDPVAEALEAAKKRKLEQARRRRKGEDEDDASEDDENEAKQKHTAQATADASSALPLTEEEKADVAVEQAEQELIGQLMPHATVFDHAYGVLCLTNLLDQLITIFLDDYLGEVSEQKEQVELMSKMVEIKSSRATQGFAFLARHAEASAMMATFLQKVAWVLTPPADNTVDAQSLHGSAKVKALMMHELRTKYVTVSKKASADLVFVNKVRLICVRVARGLMMNPSMRVEASFQQVRDLLTRHNATREEKIRAFEAKDGSRRIRGNAHLIIHKAERASLKELRDRNYVVEPVPERVDVDFSAHTVLATQQRQKLRLYKGRYGKDLKEAAKDFYREDPATAVVLDTMDEFLLKYLLSVLKQVLGIGKEGRYSKAAVHLDLLRQQKQHRKQSGEADGKENGNNDEEEEEERLGRREDEVQDESAENVDEAADNEDDKTHDNGDEEDNDDEDAMAALDPQDIDMDDEDALDDFAETQAAAQDGSGGGGSGAHKDRSNMALLAKHNLTAAFTREHRPLLESLVPVVLSTLEGEGSDPVVGNALDCLLALVSLRPPLDSVHAMEANLLDTVAGFLMRGGAIKQRAMRVCAALVCHQKFELEPDQAVPLIALARSEIIERSVFLPMALSLFHSVLRKHVHVVEVYDLIDLVTELMVHLGAKRGIRYRCVQILVRFLTEFKLTPEKFRSHINQFCRNLDYPELAGALALLEMLDALAFRLPTVVLREEAPVLLPPLAAVVLRGQWREARERAGQVIQHLVKLAGVDVLVPLLSAWMDPAKPRPTRQMAAQVWATMIPAVASAYGLDKPDTANAPEDGANGEADEAAAQLRDARDGFDQCCAWSLEAVLNGCLYNQYEAAGGKKVASGESLHAKFKAKAEMKGWEQIFYNLRCAEALFTASPSRMYPRLGAALLPALVEHLLLHTHPWIQAVSVRILRHYCYTFVEHRSGYLVADADTLATQHALAVPPTQDDGARDADSSMLFVVPSADDDQVTTAPASVEQLQDALRSTARALKQCLTRVAMSDVSNETYNAHRAINSPSRAESLKLMVYLLRAVSVLSLRLRLSADAPTIPVNTRRSILSFLEKELGLLRRHVESIAAPVLRQGRVVNYMVRTATLVQLFGGLVSILPTPATAEDVVAGTTAAEDESEDVAAVTSRAAAIGNGGVGEHAAAIKAFNDAASWLMGSAGLQILRFVQDVAAPLIGIALRAASISDRLSTLAHQSASVMAQQLETRRPLLRKHKSTTSVPAAGGVSKRQRDAATTEEITPDAKKRKKETGPDNVASSVIPASGRGAAAAASEMPSLDTVLGSLTTHVAAVRQERRDLRITQETHKVMKRNRREMDRNGGF